MIRGEYRMRSKKIISLILALSVILSVFGIIGTVAQNTQKFYNATTVADATDYSWWQFETSGSQYKIKNVKTGWYLTNNNGTLALSTTADSDNELWVHQSNYGITGHIYSKVDNSYITLRLGTLSLLPKSDFSKESTQSIRMFDENGNPFTPHTTNPVPFCVVGYPCELREGGRLADICPTMLTVMGLEQPKEMTGECLIK